MSRPVYGEMFFDRTEEIAALRQNLDLISSGEPRNVCLRGIRKSGKTSILFELKRRHVKKNVIMPYVYLLDETSVSFGRKYVQAILYETISHRGDHAPETVRELIAETIKLAPSLADYLLKVRESINKKLTIETLEILLDLPEKLGDALGVVYWIQMDEFQRLKDINISGTIDILREKILKQKRTSYLVAGSAMRLMHELFDANDSPLFGHFEILTIGPFKYEDARAYVQEKLSICGLTIPEILLNFMLAETGGYPFYLYALTDRICRITTHKEVSRNDLEEAFVREVYDPDGRVYINIKQLMEDSLGRKGLAVYLAVMKAVAQGRNTISDVSLDAKIPMTELSTPMRKLVEIGFISKGRGGYVISIPMLLFWLRNVHSLESKSFLDLDERYHRFKSQFEQMMAAFKSELGIARESQIREIFSQMGKFDEVRGGDLEGFEFDLICRRGGKTWLGEIKTNIIDSAAVDNFFRKCGKAGPVDKKILVSLFGIDKKAASLAKKLGIEVWNLERVNKERAKYKLGKIRI